MTVSEAQLEAGLAKVEAQVRDPRAGVFGPSSMIWRVNRERLLFLSSARGALLQEAHPFVAQAIDHHSAAKRDSIGRFVRTFRLFHGMLFGDLETAFSFARQVFRYHTQVRGTFSETIGQCPRGSAYEANDERALFWIHATVWESSLLTYELIFGSLTALEREQYYQETKLFAYMFGVDDAFIPDTLADFEAYNERMWNSAELAVGRAARDMADFLLSPEMHAQEPLLGLTQHMAAGLLPARLRSAYDLPFGPLERARYHAIIQAARLSWRALPRAQRFVPGYLEACARLGTAIVPTMAERLASVLLPAQLQQSSALTP